MWGEHAMSMIGERLEQLRKRRGWSQLHVEDMTGIPNYNVSNYERTERTPDVHTLAKLAALYEVSLDWLVTGKEAQSPTGVHGANIDLKELLLRNEVLFEGEELTPEAVHKLICIVRYVISEEQKKCQQ